MSLESHRHPTEHSLRADAKHEGVSYTECSVHSKDRTLVSQPPHRPLCWAWSRVQRTRGPAQISAGAPPGTLAPVPLAVWTRILAGCSLHVISFHLESFSLLLLLHPPLWACGHGERRNTCCWWFCLLTLLVLSQDQEHWVT